MDEAYVLEEYVVVDFDVALVEETAIDVVVVDDVVPEVP